MYRLYFGTAMGGIPSALIPVTHPNDLGLDPGAVTDLYYYDGAPTGSGTGSWLKAGTGTVSADWKTFVSDAGSALAVRLACLPWTGVGVGVRKFCV